MYIIYNNLINNSNYAQLASWTVNKIVILNEVKNPKVYNLYNFDLFRSLSITSKIICVT